MRCRLDAVKHSSASCWKREQSTRKKRIEALARFRIKKHHSSH